MSQEDKELLIKDLCARLPYGVKFLRESWNYEWDQEMSVIETLEDIDNEGYINHTRVYKVEDIKPYLRPMSSMTKKETKELFKEIDFEFTCNTWGIPAHYNYEFAKQIKGIPTITNVEFVKVIDWLNAHHFDYRGLIEKGLAIAVTEENNPYKNNYYE